jgi:hypothetical protein
MHVCKVFLGVLRDLWFHGCSVWYCGGEVVGGVVLCGRPPERPVVWGGLRGFGRPAARGVVPPVHASPSTAALLMRHVGGRRLGPGHAGGAGVAPPRRGARVLRRLLAVVGPPVGRRGS